MLTFGSCLIFSSLVRGSADNGSSIFLLIGLIFKGGFLLFKKNKFFLNSSLAILKSSTVKFFLTPQILASSVNTRLWPPGSNIFLYQIGSF
eukprot:01681.XXX_7743_8015_1 [CDS] Oithona nana genome sequencing.